MSRFVVIGTGLGGMSAAYKLRETLGKGHDITVVGVGDRFSFTLSNPWLAVGWRKPDDITLPVAGSLSKHNIRYNGDGVQKIEPEANRVSIGSGEVIGYDYLETDPLSRLPRPRPRRLP